jgi:antitoxin component YwqK of YwqJK toxin-antitoxin module
MLVLEGRWHYRRTDGTSISEGQFREGKPTGVWRFWDEKGVLISEEEHPPYGIVVPSPE